MARGPSWTRRSFIRTAATAASVAPLAIRAGLRSAHAAGTFSVMSVGGSWGDAIKEMIGGRLQERYDTEIAYDHRPNAQQLASIQAMRGNPSVDTVEVGGPRIGQALALDLFDELDPAIVTHYENILPAFRRPRIAGRVQVPMALTFNTSYVDRAEAEAKGWQLMLEPKLRGRVAIPKFGWQGELWMNAINLALGGSYDNFDPIIDLSRKIIQENDGLVMVSNDQGMQMLSTEEIWAAPFWTGRTYQLKDKGMPLDFVYPPGWYSYYTAFGVVKGAPNRELAMQWVNISLEPEVQVEMAEKFAYPPTNRKALPMVAGMERLQIPEAAMQRASNVDYSELYKYSDKNLERWNKEVLG